MTNQMYSRKALVMFEAKDLILLMFESFNTYQKTAGNHTRAFNPFTLKLKLIFWAIHAFFCGIYAETLSAIVKFEIPLESTPPSNLP